MAFDRSPHMLAFARRRFAGLPLRCTRREHRAIGGVKGEIFVEGWSFGHEIIAHAGSLPAAAARLEAVIRRSVKPGGTAIIIETLGTNAGKIRIPHPALAAYYRILESSLGYRRRAIRTDYRFDSPAEAARIMGFFFGPGMERRIAASGLTVVPEWTGVWWKRLP